MFEFKHFCNLKELLSIALVTPFLKMVTLIKYPYSGLIGRYFMKRRTFLKLVIGAAIVTMSGSLGYYYVYQPVQVSRTEKSTITIVDTLGRTVTLPYPVESCIVTDDNVAESVQLIGAADKVIGIEDSIPERGYFPEMSDKPTIGNQFRGLNYELIVKLKPDVVIMMGYRAAQPEQTLKKLDEIGVKAICIGVPYPELEPKTIEILGKIFGKEERAKAYLKWRDEKINLVKERLTGLEKDEKVRVYVEMQFNPQSRSLSRRTWGKNYPMQTTLEWASLKNIAEEKFPTFGEVDLEWVIKENPDIMFLGDWSDGWTGYKKTDTSIPNSFLESVKANEAVKQIKAVKENKVYVINYMLLGTRAVVGVQYLAKAAYPEKFADIDPEEIHQEYFEKWLGVKYQGIWFYPRLD